MPDRAASGIKRMIEAAIRDLLERKIPAGAIRDQLPGGALPPTGNTGTGYTPGDGSVESGKLADDAVTYAKMQNVSAASRLIGRGDSGAGDPQEIALGTGLAMSGTTLNASGGGASLTVEEIDGSPTDSAVTKIKFPNGTLSIASHEATYTPATSAPSSATYITQTHDSTLSAEQALSDLATGVLKSTTSTGVISIATGADLPGMVASGGSHSAGAVPDPGASSGTTKFLREDASWQVPSGTGNSTGTGASGSEPGGPTAGNLYFENNGIAIERYSGSAWERWGPIWPLAAPPTASWSWDNQGGASETQTASTIFLAGAGSGSTLRIRYRTAPSAPYTITALIGLWTYPSTAGPGICFREGSSGKVHAFRFQTTSALIISDKWTTATTFSANYTTDNTFAINQGLLAPYVWLRIADNNTNRVCSISLDGITFVQIDSQTRTDFLTADQVGWLVRDGTGNVPRATLISWKVT